MATDASLYRRFQKHEFRRPPELEGRAELHTVAILGAGPVGLTLALALARRGVKSVVIEARDGVGFGSRAICLSRRSLEIWDRLGVVDPIVAQGLPWTAGRSYWGTAEILRFEMPHVAEQKYPPMLNLQQCFVEQYLIDPAMRAPEIDLRWHSTAVDIAPHERGATLRIDTPEGAYDLETSWLVACDGARSFARRSLGLKMEGTSYEGRYVIADVAVASDAPTERRAWFDPPSNPRSTLLMHRQPENVWRIDYQLRDDEDETVETREDNVRTRIDAHLAYIGESPDYTLVWHSLYKAHAVSLERYVHGRVVFAGDAAHLVPIFGVRGLNSGVDDAWNLAWKLANVASGEAGESLLESYSEERVFAAHENIRQSRKSTLFMTPPTAGYELVRDAALALAVDAEFARALADPRQTSAIAFPDSPLSLPDAGGEVWSSDAPRVGMTLPNEITDRVVGRTHLQDAFGSRPVLLVAGSTEALAATNAVERTHGPDIVDAFAIVPNNAGEAGGATIADSRGRVAKALDLAPGSFYLVRPDGHVAARGRDASTDRVAIAIDRMLGDTVHAARR